MKDANVNTMAKIHWLARYEDRSVLSQYNADGTENKYADIQRDKLRAFELWAGDNLKLRVHFDDPRKDLIYRRRVHFDKNSKEPKLIQWLVGWQMNIKNKNIQSISVLFDDGHVENLGRWQDNIFFEAPTPHPHEGEKWTVE